MSDISQPSASTPPAPEVSSLELERLRREVKARLFGLASDPLRIGRYAILGCIGTGGMGIVYAARDERLGRTVAIKLLKPELSGRQTTDLAVEARSLAQLSHPNVVAVYDVGEHEGQLFVAMEYVEGENLRRWLSGTRSLAEILDVFIAAGEGLAAAHEAGLVHRDFKPDNVLVGVDRRPRILDFGLARGADRAALAAPPAFADDAEATMTSLSRHGVLLGTPAYMAPEQHLGERADARSDQFGFCVALYQAVYAELPFPSEDLRSLSLAIVGGRVRTPRIDPRVPGALRQLILRGLAIQPDSRFPTMTSLLAELRRIRAELASASSPSADAPVYDTRAIQQVFGVEARPSESSGRPPLSQAELHAIADEVGLELVPTPTSTPAPSSRPPAAIPSTMRLFTDLGMATHVRSERALSSLPSIAATRRVVREFEQNLGGAGTVEQFETGMTWANAEAEAALDRQPRGALLTLRRSFAKLARKRRTRGVALGGAAGLTLGAIFADFVPVMLNGLELLLVLGGLALGILVGHRIAKQIHDHHMSEEQRQLDWLAQRIGVLTEGETAGADPR
ncbi:serine/threonine-protein kinase [Nannocystaceae bacterium ST9]